MLWVPITLAAAALQTARNATQRGLVETIGTVGATQVRFLYGFPFALVFLGLVLAATDDALPSGSGSFWPFVSVGALTQILATALMLAAMRDRSFAVVTAIIKTEPIQVAAFGFLVLGDRLTPLAAIAVVVATLGVLLMSASASRGDLVRASRRGLVLGLVAGACFGLSAVLFRGAILSLDGGSFVTRATTVLVWSLGLQTMMLLAWLILFDRAALTGSLRAWRGSIVAGFLGAAASLFWFIGFSLTAAANVRTLALVEILMAQAVSRRIFAQRTSGREMSGMALVVVGVVLLLVAAA